MVFAFFFFSSILFFNFFVHIGFLSWCTFNVLPSVTYNPLPAFREVLGAGSRSGACGSRALESVCSRLRSANQSRENAPRGMVPSIYLLCRSRENSCPVNRQGGGIRRIKTALRWLYEVAHWCHAKWWHLPAVTVRVSRGFAGVIFSCNVNRRSLSIIVPRMAAFVASVGVRGLPALMDSVPLLNFAAQSRNGRTSHSNIPTHFPQQIINFCRRTTSQSFDFDVRTLIEIRTASRAHF